MPCQVLGCGTPPIPSNTIGEPGAPLAWIAPEGPAPPGVRMSIRNPLSNWRVLGAAIVQMVSLAAPATTSRVLSPGLVGSLLSPSTYGKRIEGQVSEESMSSLPCVY